MKSALNIDQSKNHGVYDGMIVEVYSEYLEVA